MPFFENSSARKQLLILLVLLFGSSLIFTPFGILTAIPFVDGNIFDAFERMNQGETSQDIALMKYFQMISQIGLFVIPSFLFAYLVSPNLFTFLGVDKKPKINLVFLAILIGLVSSPFINWVLQLNSDIHFPAGLQKIEFWMRKMEAEALRLTELFLIDSSLSGLIVNLIIMALLAGLGEELLLRGVLQSLLVRWTKKPHLSVWLAAATFSFLHFQFFGFVPRLLLGALFGYYFYWTKNLWIPIAAHIINNAIIVGVTFISSFDSSTSITLENTLNQTPSVLSVILSSFLTLGGLFLFYTETKSKNKISTHSS